MDVTKIIEWDMGHRVPNHKNKCRHPHGHRYRLEVSMRGAISLEKGSSSEGMVVDFGDIKELMRI
ncbi:MAG: 6-carboxytetrahydropterin synthase [Oligoflexales bacterium]|nr:6-carboxytetrahydropterin synthase [Oligoflexales bacterium]